MIIKLDKLLIQTMDFVNNIEESFFPSDELRKCAHLTNINDYYRLYKLSIQDPDTFWLNINDSIGKMASKVKKYLVIILI